MAEKPPLCSSCGHYHEQGVKCSICGHVGKSQIFARMRNRADELRVVRAEIHMVSSLATNRALRDLVEALLPNVESHAGIDGRRILLFKGDMVVAASAYDILPNDASNLHVNVCIHALQVIPDYFRQGYCWRTLFEILQHTMQAAQVNICSVLFFMPSGSWMEGKLRQTGFQQVTSLPPFNYISSPQGVWLGLNMANTDGSAVQEMRRFLVDKVQHCPHCQTQS